MARLRHAFTIDAPPDRAQTLFERDILPSLYKGSTFRLAEERPGVLVLSDGAIDVDRVFDPRKVVLGDAKPRKGRASPAIAPPLERPRPRMMGVISPNVEHRQPWLYASLRRISSRRITVEFRPRGAGTEVTIDGKADRRVRDALTRLGEPGRWPERAI